MKELSYQPPNVYTNSGNNQVNMQEVSSNISNNQKISNNTDNNISSKDSITYANVTTNSSLNESSNVVNNNGSAFKFISRINARSRSESVEDENKEEIGKNKCQPENKSSEKLIVDSKTNINMKISQLLVQIYNKKKEIYKDEENLRNLNNDLQSLNLTENEELENNNFEKAQELEGAIDNIKKQMREIDKSLEVKYDQIYELREVEIGLIKEKSEVYQSHLKLMESLKEKRQTEYQKYVDLETQSEIDKETEANNLEKEISILRVEIESENQVKTSFII